MKDIISEKKNLYIESDSFCCRSYIHSNRNNKRGASGGIEKSGQYLSGMHWYRIMKNKEQKSTPGSVFSFSLWQLHYLMDILWDLLKVKYILAKAKRYAFQF